MTAKQLSVFIENRKGRLGEVLSVLKKNGVNILSLSLADTTEYGLLRLIVSNAQEAKDKLSLEGFSTMLTDVIIIKIVHQVGSLQNLLETLSQTDINVEYMYGLSTEGKDAFVVLKASDMKLADEILNRQGIETLSTEDILGL